MTLTLVLIFYVARYFYRGIAPQNYILLGYIAVAVLLFLFRRKLARCLEEVIMLYLVAVIVVLITVARSFLSETNSREGFYMGYCVAMVHRLIGYRVVKVEYMVILYIISISVKFPLVNNPGAVLNVVVVVLDLATIFLAYRSEVQDRSIFDTVFKTKKDILKFKHLLTQYLPIQMAIFANDFSKTYYINNAFRRMFKCQAKTEVKGVMEKLIIERDAIEKNKNVFASLGIHLQNEQGPLYLPRFMGILSNNFDSLRDLGYISFYVIEEEPKNESMHVLEASMNTQNPKMNSTSFREKTTLRVGQSSSKGSKSPGKDATYLDLEGNHSSKQSIRSGSSDVAYEEGVRRVFRVKVFPLLWDEAEAIAMVLDDMTQQRIITELKQADKNKDMVIAMVSHELRTPLNGMLGLIDIAKKKISHVETLSYLKACRNSGVLLLSLVNSILDMNQISHKKLNLVYTRISIADILEEMRSLFDYSCQLRRLYMDTKIEPNAPEFICTDKNRLSQILINLLGNAFKFTFQGGVTVKVNLENMHPLKVRFSVVDTGIGIKKEDQERLFKMYGKLEQQDKKINTNGVGLGLTISNTLAKMLNPSENTNSGIQVESEVNVGTTFSFIIESQHVELSKGKDPAASSSVDISSGMLNEDKDLTMLNKMAVYTRNNNENYTKLTFSSQNLDTKKRLDAAKTLDLDNFKESDEPYGSESGRHLLKKNTKTQEFYGDDEVIVGGDSSSSPNDKTSRKNRVLKAPQKLDVQVQRRWCLVVDDNPFNLMVACHIMEERKFQVKTALNGQEAIKQVVDHAQSGLTFDVILMDCQMPVMDGYEATKILKDMMVGNQVPSCPIIALTANNHDEDHEKLCNEVGMNGYVAKPLQITELESVLKKVHKIG